MSSHDTKVICDECGWQGILGESLKGKKPFDNSPVVGCPDCFSVDTLLTACDEPECWRQSTCGTPTDSGYRVTCVRHKPKKSEASNETE